MTPKVSVVLPVYNAQDTLEKCLGALVNQTQRDIEIIVVDDGSTDKSAQVIAKFAKTDMRVKYIYQQNAGQGSARNAGIARATGEYVGFVDSDDFPQPDMYEKLLSVVGDCEVAVCAERGIIRQSGKQIQGANYGVQREESNRATLDLMLNFKQTSLNNVWNKIVKREFIAEHSITFPIEHRYAEDMVFSAKCYFYAERTAITPEKLYNYMRDTSSFTYNYSVKNAWDVLENAREISGLRGIGSELDLSAFLYGMKFSSLKQLYMRKEKTDKIETKKLKAEWKRFLAENAGKSKLSGMPIVQKIKVRSAKLGCVRWLCVLIKLFGFLPAIKYMT